MRLLENMNALNLTVLYDHVFHSHRPVIEVGRRGGVECQIYPMLLLGRPFAKSRQQAAEKIGLVIILLLGDLEPMLQFFL